MRTHVVTGSASGIGRAALELLQAAGCRVIGVDRRDAAIIADLGTDDGRARMVEGVSAMTGGAIDGLVACAGVSIRPGSPETARVNYFGAVATLDGLRACLSRGDQPRAVCVASLGIVHPVDHELVEACLQGDEGRAGARADALVDMELGPLIYSSSKRALARWVRRQAPSPEWAGEGIPLNAVCPGVIDTPLAGLDDPGIHAAMKEHVPMPLHGWGQPADVASLLGWLVAPENTLVTGQAIFIDGGADAVLRGDDIW